MDSGKIGRDRLAFARAKREHIPALLAVIRRCVLELNAADYTRERVEELLDGFSPDWLENILRTRHYYEVWYRGQLVACGGVSRDPRQERQSYFTAVFVDPDFCGRGVGRNLVEFLEGDEWCRDSGLIEVPASRTAHGFYRKCGYRYRDGPPGPGADGDTVMMYKEK